MCASCGFSSVIIKMLPPIYSSSCIHWNHLLLSPSHPSFLQLSYLYFPSRVTGGLLYLALQGRSPTQRSFHWACHSHRQLSRMMWAHGDNQTEKSLSSCAYILVEEERQHTNISATAHQTLTNALKTRKQHNGVGRDWRLLQKWWSRKGSLRW